MAGRGGRLARDRETRPHALAAALVAVLSMAVACESAPVRAWQAGRLYVRGSEALDRGEHAQAIAALEEAARLAPRASEVRNHLGLAYLSAGQPERARAAFETALELDCDNTAARANLARLDALASGLERQVRRVSEDFDASRGSRAEDLSD